RAPSETGEDPRDEDLLAQSLLRIPLQQPHFNPSPFQSLLKYRQIRPAIVIRNHNLRMKSLYRVSRFLGRHRVRQVHAHERHIDILELPHLWDAFGIARKVEALAAVSEHITVAASLIMKEFSRRRPALQVVSRNRLNRPSLPALGLSIGNRLGAGHSRNHCRRRKNLRLHLSDFLDRIRIHVIAMNVRNQNEVRSRKPRQFRRLRGIEVDDLSPSLNQRAGMIKRGDLHRPSRRKKALSLGGGERCTDREQEGKNRYQFHCGLSGTLAKNFGKYK